MGIGQAVATPPRHDLPQGIKQLNRRFETRFEARLAKRRAKETAWWAHPVRIVLGTTLLLAAVAIGWLPGPGFVPLAVLGGLLLGGEIRWVAKRLDTIEAWSRERLTRKKTKRMREESRQDDVQPQAEDGL